jgi:hypothetical protein
MTGAKSAPAHFELDLKPTPALYLAVGLEAGAVIALQICIMRIFAVGSWAHFGSLVVSLAMLGFGLTSAVMCIGKNWFERHWRGVATASLLLFGPLTVASNLLAQQIPFNAIFLISDPMQKWRLAGNFLLYMLPFLAGALYLGTVFLKANKIFGRVYFADLTGAGLCGLALLVAMYLSPPENLIVVPLMLWFLGSLLWFSALANRRGAVVLSAVAVAAVAAHFALPPLIGTPKLAVSDYKGVAYARKFPDSERVYARASPFGYLEIYSSSYLHFAPGLSDNAAFSLPKMPDNAYLGMYIDGEGPSGIIRDLPAEQTVYYRFLPMFYPYLLKPAPDTFVVQFGGGISTSVALRGNSRSVTVAEGNPAVLDAFRTDKGLRDFTGDVLNHPKLREHTRAMSFDEIYHLGFDYDQSQTGKVLEDYERQIFFDAGAETDSQDELKDEPKDAPMADRPPAEAAAGEPQPPPETQGAAVPATIMGQLAWHHLVHGGWDEIAERYVFDTRPLTNARPYFAAYVKPGDLPRVADRLELLQDEWGYLLLWATLVIAGFAALSLILIPVIFGWRTIFSHNPGKFRTIVYFACLGAGYIMVEVGLISDFMLALSNATVSASVLITGMLVFSGLGAFVSERFLSRARNLMPKIFIAIAALLIGYGLVLDRVLDLIGTLPYGWRLIFCFALIFPPAFLMGFPMPTAMTSLARLGKDHMFLWAWGINGCFSVIGAASVPIIATLFGLSAVLIIAGGAYLLAIPAFFAVLLPLRRAPASVPAPAPTPA